MSAFLSGDVHRFFGRDREANDVRDRWLGKRLTVLYGPSGIGKTSLINAGVVPLLDRHALDVLPVGRVSCGSAFPRAALPSHNPYVLALLQSWSPGVPPTRLAGLTLPGFLRTRHRKRDLHGRPLATMVVIDQVEELFAGFDDQQASREWFFSELAEALAEDDDLRVLLSIRSDRLIDFLPHEGALVPREAPSRYALEALGLERAKEAVAGPLEGTGRSFTSDAVDLVVGDLAEVRARSDAVREGVDPVQLQVVCQALWHGLPEDLTRITAADVSYYGDADEALSEHYDRSLREIADERFNGDDHRLRVWLRQTFPDGKPVPQSSVKVGPLGEATVSLLVRRHILRADLRMGDGCYELAYDRLTRALVARDEQSATRRRRLSAEDYLRAAEYALGEGDLVIASKYANEALVRSRESDLRVRAKIESLLGNIAYARDELDSAVSRYQSAARDFERAGAVRSVGPLLTAVGRLRLRQKKPEEAVRELGAAVARVPADLAIKTELAWALWHDSKPRAAVDVLDEVLDREGSNPDALLSRGQILAGMGKAEAALRDLELAQPLSRPFAKIAHALALAELDNLKEAQQEMVEALVDNVDDGPLLLYAARVQELAGHPALATDLAERALKASTPALPEHLKAYARHLAGPG